MYFNTNRETGSVLKASQKKTRKAHQMKNPGQESNYARKRVYLHKNGGFGFDYGYVKPWKS